MSISELIAYGFGTLVVVSVLMAKWNDYRFHRRRARRLRQREGR